MQREDIAPMMPFALAATLIGVVIGQRFTMAALIPTMAFTLVIVATTRITDGAAFSATMTDLVMFLICLQIGYYGGAGIRFLRCVRTKMAGNFRNGHP